MPLLVLGVDGCGLMSKPSSPETEKHSFKKNKDISSTCTRLEHA